MERVVLGCVADVDLETAVQTLTAASGVDVVAVVVDLGDSREIEDRRNTALRAGAVRAHVLDAREALACEGVGRALKASAFGPRAADVMRALAAPVVAERIVEAAGIERAAAAAFPFAGDGALLRTTVQRLAPTLRLIDVGAIAGAADVTVAAGPAAFPAARASATVELSFDAGVPAGVNGVAMSLVDVLASLAMLAREHGIGTGDGSAAAILQPAHDALRRAVTSRDLDRICRSLAPRYAETILDGRWFTPARRALDAFFDVVDEHVSGTVSVELGEGAARIGACRSTFADSSHGTSLVGTV